MRCVPAHDFTVAKMALWRSALDENPPYQRESSVWSLDKQQLFVDSLLNGFDIPKIYLHDLRGKHPTKVYAVVDGKQRLTTIWAFLNDEFPLADDFRVEDVDSLELPPGSTPPTGGMYFSEFHPVWQEVVKTTFLSVVLIQNATEADIEELFYRLNNGEPLNAAEKRNAFGGDMAQLVREAATRPFFKTRLRLPNERSLHLDLAARLLLIEHTLADPAASLPDLRSSTLDEFVRANRQLPEPERAELLRRLDDRLSFLEQVFTEDDPLLATQSHPPLYYLFARSITDSAAAPPPEAVRDFLKWFQAARRAELDKAEEQQDGNLVEFTRLTQNNAGSRRSLQRRVEILNDMFRSWLPRLAPPANTPA